MPLLSPDQAHALLVCPRCGSGLTRTEHRFACSSDRCIAATDAYPMLGTHPVLVVFERSIVDRDSLVRSGGASEIPRNRNRGLRRLLRGLFSPDNRVAERHAADLLARLAVESSPRLLVVGGGTVGSGSDSLYQAPGLELIAFDVYASPWTQFIADGHSIPLPDASVSAVWVQAVLEHVLDPSRVVAEIERVLKPSGYVYAETPFLQQVHEGAFDFTRFTESGHRWLFRRFERLDSGVVAGAGNQFAWTLDYLTRGLLRSAGAGKVARMAAVWANALDRVIPERFAVDAASCVFFYGRKSGRELTPREIVDHYRGAQRRSR